MFNRIGQECPMRCLYQSCHNEPEQLETMPIPDNSPCAGRDYLPLLTKNFANTRFFVFTCC